MPPMTNNHPPGNNNVIDICTGRGVDDLIRMGPCGAHRIGSDNNEVSESPVGDPAAVGPAEAAVAGLASNLDQLRGREAAAFAGRQPLVKLDSTQLLERVDHGLLIRAQGKRAAGVGQPSGGADAISKITLRRRTEACRRLAATQGLNVGISQMSGVHGRCSTTQQTMIIKQLRRSAAVESLSSSILRRLLAEVNMQGPFPRCLADHAEKLSRHRPN